MQKVSFWSVKDKLLHAKRRSLTKQKLTFRKTAGMRPAERRYNNAFTEMRHHTAANAFLSLQIKSSAMSLVKHNGGKRRRMSVEAQPVKQCCS